jgi:hypothetical protein
MRRLSGTAPDVGAHKGSTGPDGPSAKPSLIAGLEVSQAGFDGDSEPRILSSTARRESAITAPVLWSQPPDRWRKTDSVARDEISHGFDLREPSELGDPPGNREQRTGSRLSVRRASTSAS